MLQYCNSYQNVVTIINVLLKRLIALLQTMTLVLQHLIENMPI